MSTATLCRILGYTFHEPKLLNEALTHRSSTGPSNERLEFLGDAILNLVIAEALYARYPHASEGELSRLRASLVKEATLAALARNLALGECLRLGGGELKSGGFRRDSILADALEAVFGAIFLDSDFTACRDVILRLYRQRLAELPPAGELKDPKTQLQEYLQARQQPLPVYRVLATGGADHARQFEIECAVAELRTVATGSSRRKAEQEAARKALALLE